MSTINFNRYFRLKQRAYLINISEARDRDQYESLSGTIVECNGELLALQIPYAIDQEATGDITYKLTSESMGGGIQIMADLVKVTQGNVFHLKLRGNLEMYQRRQTPRLDVALKLFQIRKDASLAVYRKEYRRIVEYLNNQGLPPNLKLQETPINLSAGGLCITIEPNVLASSLALFFLDLNDGKQPVCAIAELVWSRNENGKQMGGHRFLQISKLDQERIGQYVHAHLKDKGAGAAPKINWELSDRMTFQEGEKK